MKRLQIYSLLIITLSLIFSSCGDILDVENTKALSPYYTWNDKTLATAYLTDLYASASPKWSVNDASDAGVDGHGTSADESIGILETDYVQSANSKFKDWNYGQIRKINILLNEIDGGTLSDEVRNVIKAQAHFLRAYQYFKMVIIYGGVPIIKEPQSLDDDLFVSRNTTKECFDFIIEDLDIAISMLPNKFTGDDYGRVDKAAALAFKGRVLLFKASPQFNPSNPFGNSYWQDAYTATKAAKDQLETWGYGLVDNYNDIFLTEEHQEAVWAVVYINPGKTNGGREAAIRPLSVSGSSSGADQPIWEFVESYPMLDGKQPGESTKYSYDAQTYWRNRDPRLDATVVYNGCVCPYEGVEGRRIYMDGQVGLESDAMSPTSLMYCHTGFFCRKGSDLSLTQAQFALNELDWIEIRFAEVLMNYAEAANEMNHPSEAIAVLKRIRERAGIEPGADGMYGITASTKEDIREAIHFENRIEFAFEGSKRFWELRRMRMLSVIDGTREHGLQPVLKTGLDPNADVTYLPEDFDYIVHEPFALGSQKVNVISDNYYFFPISKSEIEKNPNLKQTQGWDGGTFNPTLE